MDDAAILRLLRQVYGAGFDRHEALRVKSNAHRQAHGPACTVYPSAPALGPIWPFLASLTGGGRFLEVGCGLGYTAVLMAEAGGPGCRVDTVEAEREHADLAEAEVSRAGFAGLIRVLRGRAIDILPVLSEAYDVVFIDAGPAEEYVRLMDDLVRLTRPGGVLVSSNISPDREDWGGPIGAYLTALARDPRLRTFIVPHLWKGLSVRLPAS